MLKQRPHRVSLHQSCNSTINNSKEYFKNKNRLRAGQDVPGLHNTRKSRNPTILLNNIQTVIVLATFTLAGL